MTVKLQVGPIWVVQVTLDVPFGKKDPAAGVQVTETQSPVVVGVGKFTTAPHCPASFVFVRLAGGVIEHGMMVTVKLQFAVLFEVSVAVHVTVVVVPGAKQVVGGGEQTTVTP